MELGIGILVWDYKCHMAELRDKDVHVPLPAVEWGRYKCDHFSNRVAGRAR